MRPLETSTVGSCTCLACRGEGKDQNQDLAGAASVYERWPDRIGNLRWRTAVPTQPLPSREEPGGRYQTPLSFHPLISYLCLPMTKLTRPESDCDTVCTSHPPQAQSWAEKGESVSQDPQRITSSLKVSLQGPLSCALSF